MNRTRATVIRANVERRAAHASIAAIVVLFAAVTPATPQAPATPPPSSSSSSTREPASAAPRNAPHGVVVLIDGSTLSGVVTGLGDAGVSMKAGDAPARVVPWSECLGVFFDGVESRVDQESSGSVAVLADGRRIPGRAEANASGMRWRQRWLGVIELPQSDVRWISFDGEAPVLSVVDSDVVRLRTGDRLEGFVSRLSDPLVIEPREAGSATQVPLSNVQSVAFVTAETAREVTRRRVWLEDGTVIDAEAVAFDADEGARGVGVPERGERTLERGAEGEEQDVDRESGGAGGADEATLRGIGMGHGRPLTVPRGAVAAVAGERRGEPLAHRPMRTAPNDQSAALRYETTPAERLMWPRTRSPSSSGRPAPTPPTPPASSSPSPSSPTNGRPPVTTGDATVPGAAIREFDDGAWPLGLPAIAFDGPAILRIDIDQPAMLAARLVLPRDRRPRGDFEVVVRSGGRELARRRFDVSRPALDVSFDVVPPAVEFEIIDTGGGAVQDGLVIERGVLIPRAAR